MQFIKKGNKQKNVIFFEKGFNYKTDRDIKERCCQTLKVLSNLRAIP